MRPQSLYRQTPWDGFSAEEWATLEVYLIKSDAGTPHGLFVDAATGIVTCAEDGAAKAGVPPGVLFRGMRGTRIDDLHAAQAVLRDARHCCNY